MRSPAKKKLPALSQQVYEHVLRQLLTRSLLPGEMLNRRAIADELNISIAPVLEALVRLEAEGLLHTIPRKGTQVRLIRTEDIADQMVVREAIECQAARHYCGQPIIHFEQTLRPLADAVDEHPRDVVNSWKRELEFHRALVELAGSRSLLSAFNQAMHLGTLCAADVLSLTGVSDPIGNHRFLLEKLKTKDGDAAEDFMRAHLHSGKRYFFQTPPLDQLPVKA